MLLHLKFVIENVKIKYFLKNNSTGKMHKNILFFNEKYRLYVAQKFKTDVMIY